MTFFVQGVGTTVKELGKSVRRQFLVGKEGHAAMEVVKGFQKGTMEMILRLITGVSRDRGEGRPGDETVPEFVKSRCVIGVLLPKLEDYVEEGSLVHES